MIRWMVIAIGLVIPVTAHAWGEIGHQAICEIAYQELLPEARAKVDTLMAADSQYDRFAESCSWADTDVRPARSDEHYVNIPRDFRGFTSSDCPMDDECVLSAIEQEVTALSSPNSSEEEKLVALKMLGHWVGDVHQPLHVSFADDRGGNDVRGTGRCGSNLHATWDSCFFRFMLDGQTVTEFADDLQTRLSPGVKAMWRYSLPFQWANESFAVVTSPEVGYCIWKDGSCWYSPERETYDDGSPRTAVHADGSYLREHWDIVVKRIQMAGVRLGATINNALVRNGTE